MPLNRSPTLKLVSAAVMNDLWCITPDMYARIQQIVEERAAGMKPDMAEIEARIDGKTYGAESADSTSNTVRVIALQGVLISRAGMMEAMSGASSPQVFAQTVRQAADDPQISHIVLDVDSPGGSVSGTPIAAEAVTYAASKKPTIAVINDMACSAALWIATQASEVVTPPQGTIGSIGVIGTHVDRSKQMAAQGVKHTVIRSTPGKALGQPSEAMSGKALEQAQARIDAMHAQFIQAIATGRGMSLEAAAALGTGEVWMGQQAVDNGLADRLGTLASVLAELSGQADGQEAVTLPAAAIDTVFASDGKFQKDARVKVKGKPHMAGHSTGVVKLVESPTSAYGIVFDGMEDMGIHKWYVESELEAEATDSKPLKKPMKMNGQGEDMDIAAITAKLNAGTPLSAEERDFITARASAQTMPSKPDMSQWPAEARAAVEQAQRTAESAQAAAEQASAAAKVERDTRLNKEFADRAVAIGQPVEFGATLRALHESNPEAAAATEQALKAAHAQSNLTREIGTANTRPGAADPQARIEARAKELEASGMKGDDAYTAAMQELAGESSEYQKEVRA